MDVPDKPGSCSSRISLKSLIDLKSELERKHVEAARQKDSAKESSSTLLNIKEKVEKAEKVFSKKVVKNKKSIDSLEVQDNALAASRQKLEAKAKLYDILKEQGLDPSSGASELILVDFNKKAIEESKSFKLQIKGIGDLPSPLEVADAEAIRAEQLKKKWEKEEIEASLKGHVTYQDVFFDEARTHGAGYYAFSRDEAERSAQKANLEAIRVETEEKQRTSAQEKKSKEKDMKERLKKVRQKKRLQMGLPLEEEVEEEEEEEMVGPIPVPESVDVTSTSVPLEPSASVDASEPLREVRPWDIGKSGVTLDFGPIPRKVLSQEEWVDERRSIRQNEFAPPVAYSQPRGPAPRGRSVRPPSSAPGRGLRPSMSASGRGAYVANMYFARQQFKNTAKPSENSSLQSETVEKQGAETSILDGVKSRGAVSLDREKFEVVSAVSDRKIIEGVSASSVLSSSVVANDEGENNTLSRQGTEVEIPANDEGENNTLSRQGTEVEIPKKRITAADLFRQEMEMSSNPSKNRSEPTTSSYGSSETPYTLDTAVKRNRSVSSMVLDEEILNKQEMGEREKGYVVKRDKPASSLVVDEEILNKREMGEREKSYAVKRDKPASRLVVSEEMLNKEETGEKGYGTVIKLEKANAKFGGRYLEQKHGHEKPGKNLKLYSSDITENSESDMRAGDRNKSAIPPPTSMDYYSSLMGKKPSVVKRPKLEDSVAVGLMMAQEKKKSDGKKKDKGMLALF